MANLFSAPWPRYVKNQIEAKQYMVALRNRDLNITRYLTNRMPWMRMISTTNINQPNNRLSSLHKLINFGFDESNITGHGLRRKFILQNHPKEDYESTTALNFTPPGTIMDGQYGFSRGIQGDEFAKGLYGLGGIEERGYVPPPGITNISAEYINDGYLLTATVGLKAYNQNQFYMMDTLFMRPGYQVLLEWGWTSYYELPRVGTNISSGNPQLAKFPSGRIEDFQYYIDPNNFVNIDSTYQSDAFSMAYRADDSNIYTNFDLYEAIKRDREKFQGNYDGLIGTVTNFKWNLESDGSYTVTINLDGMGAQVESMKMDVGSGNVQTTSDERDNASDSDVSNAGELKDSVDSGRFKTLFNNYLSRLIALDKEIGSYSLGTGALPSSITFGDVFPLFNTQSDYQKLLRKQSLIGGPAAGVAGAINPIRRNALYFENFPRPYSLDPSTSFPDQVWHVDRSTIGSIVDSNGMLYIQWENLTSTPDTTLTESDCYYLSFSCICAFIQSNLILYDKSRTGKKTPVFYIDPSIYNLNAALQETPEHFPWQYYQYSYPSSPPNTLTLQTPSGLNIEELRQKDKTYMFTFPGQFSSDVQKVIIPVKKLGEATDSQGNITKIGKIDEYDIVAAASRPDTGESLFSNLTYVMDRDFSEALGTQYDSQWLGDLGTVFISFRHIADILDDLEEESDTVSVLDFFRRILDDISISLGSINQLSVYVTDEGEINFQENRPQVLNNGRGFFDGSDYTTLNIFGVRAGNDPISQFLGGTSDQRQRVIDTFSKQFNQFTTADLAIAESNQGKGSIVKSYGLTSTISKEMTTMVTVGAQANANEVGEDSTALSNYNIGLVDTLMPTKTRDVDIVPNVTELSTFTSGVLTSNFSAGTIDLFEYETLIKLALYLYKNRGNLLYLRSYSFEHDGSRGNYTILKSKYRDITTQFNEEYAQYIQGVLQQFGLIRPNFFLPFSMKITMDGISGIRLRSKFLIEDEALPLAFKGGAMELLVEGVSHTIDNNGWEVELSTYTSAIRDVTTQAAATSPIPAGTLFNTSLTGFSADIADGTEGDPIIAQVTYNGVPLTVNSITPSTYQLGINTYTIDFVIPPGFANSGQNGNYSQTAEGTAAVVVSSPSPGPSGTGLAFWNNTRKNIPGLPDGGATWGIPDVVVRDRAAGGYVVWELKDGKGTPIGENPPLAADVDISVITDPRIDNNDLKRALMKIHPQYREVFKEFFIEISGPAFDGYKYLINAIGRSIAKGEYLQDRGSSATVPNGKHFYNIAIDMNITNPAGETGGMSSNKHVWINSGIPQIAYKYKMVWGNYRSFKDWVHFAVDDGFPGNKLKMSNFAPQIEAKYPGFKRVNSRTVHQTTAVREKMDKDYFDFVGINTFTLPNWEDIDKTKTRKLF